MTSEREVALTHHINLYEVMDPKIREVIFSDRDVDYMQLPHFFVGFIPANSAKTYMMEVTLYNSNLLRPLNDRTEEYRELEETYVKQILEKHVPKVVRIRKRPGFLMRLFYSIFGTSRG